MKKFVCELGGYEVLLRGNVSDATRAAIARVADHPPVTIHSANVSRAIEHMAMLWRTGRLFWGPDVGREAVFTWFAAHKRDGTLKPERERELAAIVLAAMKEQGAL